MLMPVRRIQIHLEDELDEALARQALDRGIAKAALIREYLALHVSKEHRNKDRSSQRLIGVYEGTAGESSSVDDVLYGR
jgi:ribbon-helix-helix CopG family protein